MKKIYKIVIFCILLAAVVLTQGSIANPIDQIGWNNSTYWYVV